MQTGAASERARTDPRVGTVVAGRYRVLRLVAEGGMGAVYEVARDPDGHRLALKVLHAHYARDPDVVARFRREALAAASIGHPGIVGVLELGDAGDGSLYMTLELLRGTDLAGVLRRDGPLTVGRAARIVVALCDALAAAHDKGIVHRDLKPENVFCVERPDGGEAFKLLDFGISKIRGPLAETGAEATRTGTALGTPYAMAPEQARGAGDVDARADLYACGVLLFRLLTGQHPFDDPSFPVLVVKICTEPPPPLRRYRRDVPEALERLVERLLAKDPAERPASARELAEALAPFTAMEQAPELLEAPPTAAAPAAALSGRGPAGERRASGHEATLPAYASSLPAGPWSEGPLAARAAETAETRGAHAAGAAGEDTGAAPGVRGLPRWAPWLGAALGLAAVATVGVAVTRSRAPRAPPEAPSTLPEPREARTVPLAAPDRSRERGWRWINPLPRALPTYAAASVGGPGLVAFVGRRGAAARVNRAGLATWPTGLTEDLEAIAWTGAREALAAGERGALVRLSDGAPARLAAGTDATLRAVVAASSTEALVAGDGGTLLRVVGDRVEPLSSGTDAALLGLAMAGSDALAVGEGGTALRVVDAAHGGGRVVPETTGATGTLRAVGGCPDDHYAVGDEGLVLRRLPSGRWERLSRVPAESYTGVTCDGDRVAVSGGGGSALLLQAGHVVRLPGADDRPWYAIAGGRGERTWLVGAGGRLATTAADHLVLVTDGPTGPLRGLASLSGAVVAVGEYGRVLREREAGFVEAESATRAGLAAVIALGPDRLLAVGDEGALLEIDAAGTRLLPSPSRRPWRAAIGDAAGLVVVGGEGAVLRGPMDALVASRVPGVGDLWSVAGSVERAVAVGDDGAVVELSADGARRWPCAPAAGRRLRAVLAPRRSGDAGPDAREPLLAAGDGGLVVALEPRGCRVERDGGPTLHALGRGPGGAPLAAGDDGTLLERGARGEWTSIDVDVAGHSLRAIASLERHVYVAGTGGVVLRHARLDD